MRLRQKGRHKFHIIKSSHLGYVSFYLTYCGKFLPSSVCTSKADIVTCGNCKKTYFAQEGIQL